MRLQRVEIQLDRFSILFFCFFHFALCPQQNTQVYVGLNILRIGFQNVVVSANCFVVTTLQLINVSAEIAGVPIVLVAFERVIYFNQRLFVLLLGRQFLGFSQVHSGVNFAHVERWFAQRFVVSGCPFFAALFLFAAGSFSVTVFLAPIRVFPGQIGVFLLNPVRVFLAQVGVFLVRVRVFLLARGLIGCFLLVACFAVVQSIQRFLSLFGKFIDALAFGL